MTTLPSRPVLSTTTSSPSYWDQTLMPTSTMPLTASTLLYTLLMTATTSEITFQQLLTGLIRYLTSQQCQEVTSQMQQWTVLSLGTQYIQWKQHRLSLLAVLETGFWLSSLIRWVMLYHSSLFLMISLKIKLTSITLIQPINMVGSLGRSLIFSLCPLSLLKLAMQTSKLNSYSTLLCKDIMTI